MNKTAAEKGITITKISQEPLRFWCLFAVAIMPLLLVMHRSLADVLLSLVAIAFLWRSFRLRDGSWLTPLEHRWMLGLWAYTVLVVPPFADVPLKALQEGFIWLRFIVFFIAIRHWLVKERQDMHLLLAIMLPVLTVAWIDTIVQAMTGWSVSGHATNFGRLTGPMEKPVIGMYFAKLTLGLAGMVGLCVMPAGKWPRMLAMLGLAGMVWTVFATGERTASILYSAGVVAMLMALGWKRPAWRMPMAIAVVVMIGGMALLASQSSFLQERVELLSEQASSSEAVIEKSPYGQLWKAAWIVWQDAPLLGHGIRSFRVLCPPLLKAGEVWYCDLHPHNHYMEWLVGTGLIGMLGYAALAAIMLWRVLQGLRQADMETVPAWAGALGMLVIIFCPLAATQSFFSNWPGMLQWLSLSLAFAALNIRPSSS
jgi:O-antigen ligase